jgi:hypothetical protein
VQAELSPSEISWTMLAGDRDVLTHRLGADTAGSNVGKRTMLRSKPARMGDSSLPTGMTDRLFGSDCLGGLLIEAMHLPTGG